VRKPILLAVAATLFSLGLVACAPSSTAKTLTAGQQGSLDQVPWSDVGSGWSVAVWNPTAASSATPPPAAGTPELFLVSPVGGRYLIAKEPGVTLALHDWNKPGREVLVDSTKACYGCTAGLQVVDMRNGRATHPWSGSAATRTVDTFSARLATPRGGSVYANTTSDQGPSCTLVRYTLTGREQRNFPTFLGSVGNYSCGFALNPLGETIAVSGAKGIAIMTTDGTITSQFPASGTLTGCLPIKWWDANDILAYCSPSSTTSLTQLFLVSTRNGAFTALAGPPTGGDSGDLNAWELSSALYGQSAAGCGTEYLSMKGSSGSMEPVTVPSVKSGGSIIVLGATSSELLLHATLECGQGESLFFFNPSTNKTTVVLGPSVNGGAVTDGVAFLGDR
jgi:TolB protein